MKITFADWCIAAAASNARQYDNQVWELSLGGELPEGWAWAALIAQGEHLDIVSLTPNEAGASATLTAAQLSLDGYYTIQIRGTKGDQVRHTNLVQVFVPRSLSGDAAWPELPTEFSQAEKRITDASAHPPIPGEDGCWKIWDVAAGEYKQSTTPLNVDPAGKTEAMTQAVGMDASGKLWTEPGETWEEIATVTSSIAYNPTDTEQIKWMTAKQYIPGSGGRTGNYINGLRYNFAKPYKKVRLTLIGEVATFSDSDTADTKGLILTRGIADGSDIYTPIIERDIMGAANNAPRGVYVEIQKDIGERHRAIAIVGDHPAYTEDSYAFGRSMVGGFRLDYGVKGNILGVGWQMEFDSAKCYVDGKSIEFVIEGVPA